MNRWAKALFAVSAILFVIAGVWFFRLLFTPPQHWGAVVMTFLGWGGAGLAVLVCGLFVRLTRART